MKKKNKILTGVLAGACVLGGGFALTGCMDVKADVDFRIENGYVQWTDDGETWKDLIAVEDIKGDNGKDATYSNYTVTYDYGKAGDFFKTAKDSETIKSTEWLTTLPEIKDEYKQSFLGWFIAGTDKQIENHDFIGGNVTLEARFDIEKTKISGLYQNGKYVMTWFDVRRDCYGAFSYADETKIYSRSLGASYFEDLSGELIIDNSITSIGEYAFKQCKGLTSITIPNSVTSIGGVLLYGCDNLTKIIIEEGNPVYDSRDNCNAIIETSTNTLIEGCKNTIVPDSVTSIGEYAFMRCSSLARIIIPNSVTSLGNGAFYYCHGLTSITIPNSVTSIGDCVFERCSKLTSITIPNSVTSIGEDAFSYCDGLTSISISNSVTSIGEDAFNGCYNLTEIIVEEGNTVYDSRDNCNAIIETSTNKITHGCKNTVIPSSVTSIGDSAFSGCSSLTSITIPNGVTSIGSSAFDGCISLSSITIPNGVTSIERSTFFGCESLTSITIPNSVTSIGSSAFSRCDNLTEVIFKGTQEEWDAINCSLGNEKLLDGSITIKFAPEVEE